MKKVKAKASAEELTAIGIDHQNAVAMAQGVTLRVLNYRFHLGRRLLMVLRPLPLTDRFCWIFEDMVEPVDE